jgi:hypothetical protein
MLSISIQKRKKFGVKYATKYLHMVIIINTLRNTKIDKILILSITFIILEKLVNIVNFNTKKKKVRCEICNKIFTYGYYYQHIKKHKN